MAQLESTFRFKCEVNNTNLHIKRESNITSDDFDATNVELSNKNYESNDSELKPKQEVENKMEHTFDKKCIIKKELLDVTEQQQETDRAQHQLESTLGFKHYEVNTTKLHIQKELLINKYEDNALKDVENVTIKSEILDITEPPDEADLQIPRPLITIKENESEEDGTIDGVSNANEDPAVHKDREVYETIKQERKDFSVTLLSYWNNGLACNKEPRVVLEKQNTQSSFGDTTNNDVSYLKAKSVKYKEPGTHPTINKGSLTNSNNMDTESASIIGGAKFTCPELENLHGWSKNTNKTVCAKTSAANNNIDCDTDSPNNVFICDICNKSYQKKICLYQHIQGHLNLFNCTYCSYTGHKKGNLNRHINSKHIKNTVYNCSYCSYRTYDRSTLSRHVNRKHTKKTVYNCSYCSYSTCVRSTLSSHVNSKHTKETVYNCSYCSYSTHDRNTLSKHVNSKHTKNTVYSCSYCSYKAYNKSSLSNHVNSKHTKDSVYNCSYCDYKTFRKGELSRHINVIHTKINAFYCSFCNYKTYDKNTLAKHLYSKHTKNSVLKCGYCNYETHNRNNLRKHIKAKHNNNE